MVTLADGLSGGEVAGLIVAVFWAVLVCFIGYVLIKLGNVVGETGKLVSGVTDETVPLLDEVRTSVIHVNTELERVDAITANVQNVTTNVSALTAVFAATLGSPVIKVAAFSYGVRRALDGPARGRRAQAREGGPEGRAEGEQRSMRRLFYVAFGAAAGVLVVRRVVGGGKQVDAGGPRRAGWRRGRTHRRVVGRGPGLRRTT